MGLSRRDLLRSGLRDLLRATLPPEPAPAPAEQPESEPARAPFLRPPGALPEPDFLAACTRCDACFEACPRDAIQRADPELCPDGAGTPVIRYEEQPCWLCKDLPCIAACEPGALLPLDSPSEARMGRARIRFQECYAAQGNLCDVCAERCPTRPKAVRVPFGQAPALDLERCAGCGVCAWLCPAQAIDISV